MFSERDQIEAHGEFSVLDLCDSRNQSLLSLYRLQLYVLKMITKYSLKLRTHQLEPIMSLQWHLQVKITNKTQSDPGFRSLSGSPLSIRLVFLRFYKIVFKLLKSSIQYYSQTMFIDTHD